ncbi:hypothetical protein CR513_55090, partial [Mucuna pruriens]
MAVREQSKFEKWMKKVLAAFFQTEPTLCHPSSLGVASSSSLILVHQQGIHKNKQYTKFIK